MIFSLGYKYSQAVIPAVSGNDTYTSVGGTYTDPDAGLNPDGLKPVQGEIVNADVLSFFAPKSTYNHCGSADSVSHLVPVFPSTA